MVSGIQPAGHVGVIRIGDRLSGLKYHLDGVVGPHVLKGIVTDSAYALAIYQHIKNPVTVAGHNVEGPVAAPADVGAPGGGDGADLACLGGDGAGSAGPIGPLFSVLAAHPNRRPAAPCPADGRKPVPPAAARRGRSLPG